jgi:hypothetical protein
MPRIAGTTRLASSTTNPAHAGEGPARAHLYGCHSGSHCLWCWVPLPLSALGGFEPHTQASRTRELRLATHGSQSCIGLVHWQAAYFAPGRRRIDLLFFGFFLFFVRRIGGFDGFLAILPAGLTGLRDGALGARVQLLATRHDDRNAIGELHIG